MSREDPQLKIRLPADLKARVENASRAAGRSINSEVAQRLERSFLVHAPSPQEAARIWSFLLRLEDALRTFRQDLIAEDQAGVSPHGSNAAHRLRMLAEEYVRLTRPVLAAYLPPEEEGGELGDFAPPAAPPDVIGKPLLQLPQSLRDLAAVMGQMAKRLEESRLPGETPAEQLDRIYLTPSPPSSAEAAQAAPAPKAPRGKRKR